MTAPIRAAAPAAAGFFMPAEWCEHAACWMAWPRRAAAHRGFMREARRAYADVAHAVAAFEPVFVVAHPQDEKNARRILSADINVVPLPIDDAWLRDSGPTFVVNDAGEVAGVDWLFNAWGGKYPPWHDDDAVAGRILNYLSMPRYAAPLVLEGGGIHSDGCGALLTTRQCLLHKNRNPRLSPADIEQLLRDYTGAKKIIWLAGDARDDETDGHVDNIACFSAPRRVLFMRDDNDAMLKQNHELLKRAADADGAPFSLTPLPRPAVKENGVDLIASYVNFYIANGGIVMPSFGLREDEEARAVIAAEFPGRRVVQVKATDIVRGGGGIHCITQQQPRGKPAP